MREEKVNDAKKGEGVATMRQRGGRAINFRVLKLLKILSRFLEKEKKESEYLFFLPSLS